MHLGFISIVISRKKWVSPGYCIITPFWRHIPYLSHSLMECVSNVPICLYGGDAPPYGRFAPFIVTYSSCYTF